MSLLGHVPPLCEGAGRFPIATAVICIDTGTDDHSLNGRFSHGTTVTGVDGFWFSNFKC